MTSFLHSSLSMNLGREEKEKKKKAENLAQIILPRTISSCKDFYYISRETYVYNFNFNH